MGINCNLFILCPSIKEKQSYTAACTHIIENLLYGIMPCSNNNTELPEKRGTEKPRSIDTPKASVPPEGVEVCEQFVQPCKGIALADTSVMIVISTSVSYHAAQFTMTA